MTHVSGGVRMVGDLGGTHARLATLDPTGLPGRPEVLACADYPRVEDALAAYRERHAIGDLAEVCLAVAGPVDHDRVDLPNNHWEFSRRELEARLGAPLLVINDFTAQAFGIDLLHEDELSWLGTPRPCGSGIRAVVGPGTGLGVAIQTSTGEVLPSEGGHVGFSPTGDHEIDVLRVMHSRFRRVSFERLLSGPGLENLYWANRILEYGAEHGTGSSRTAPEVAKLAAQGDAVALRSVDDFFGILATFAGDVALMAWADAGVYLSGGVTRRLIRFLNPERFRARFEDKGRFTHFCQTVPVAWITVEHSGLLGCAAALADRDKPAGPGPGPPTEAQR